MKYEYHVNYMPGGSTNSKDSDMLGAMLSSKEGADGWELVSVVPIPGRADERIKDNAIWVAMFFKRPAK
jgi:hypothetical protein